MFDMLEERIKRDDDAAVTHRERRIRNTIVIVLSVVLFGGLYAALRFIDS